MWLNLQQKWKINFDEDALTIKDKEYLLNIRIRLFWIFKSSGTLIIC
jgi:hypothetical protein